MLGFISGQREAGNGDKSNDVSFLVTDADSALGAILGGSGKVLLPPRGADRISDQAWFSFGKLAKEEICGGSFGRGWHAGLWKQLEGPGVRSWDGRDSVGGGLARGSGMGTGGAVS